MKLRYEVFAAVIALTASSPSFAADLVMYAMSSNINATYNASNIASTSLLRNATTQNKSNIGNEGFGNTFIAYSSSGAVDAATAFSLNSYFSISLQAIAGQTLELSGLTFDVGKGGDNDPRGLFIRSSADNFIANLFILQLPVGPKQAPAMQNVDFGNLFTGLTGATFRFYTYVPSTDNSVDFRNINFTSSAATPAVPEPATWAMMILGMGAVGFGLRRRQKVRVSYVI